MSERVCTNCKFCVQQDFGYSNWTVEGTNASCLFSLIQEFDTAEYVKGHEKNKQDNARDYAKTCFAFREGPGLYIDCDGEQKEENIIAWINQYSK